MGAENGLGELRAAAVAYLVKAFREELTSAPPHMVASATSIVLSTAPAEPPRPQA